MRRHPRWSVAVVIVGLTIVAVVSYGAWIYSSARSVERMLDRAESLDISGIAAGNENALAAAETLTEESNDAVRSLSGRLGPVRIAETLFGWFPWVGDQLRAPDLLLERADASLDSTEPLIAAANNLAALRELIDSGQITGSRFGIDSLVRSASEAAGRMIRVTEAAEAMDGISLLPVFERRAKRISALEERLLKFSDLLAATPTALSQARDVLTAGLEVAELLEGSDAAPDLQAMSEKIDELSAVARAATPSTSQLERMANEAIAGTDLARFASTLSTSVSAIADLSEGLATIVEVVGNSADVLAGSDSPLLSDGDRLQGALEPLVQERPRLSDAVSLSSAALERLRSAIDSGSGDLLPDDLAGPLIDRAGDLIDAGDLIVDGPELLLSLTGNGAPKRYLVLGQTSDELRAAGGFTSSAWTLTFEDGALTDTTFIPILLFEDRDLLSQSPPPPEPLSFYMNTGSLYLRDVGWDPDFGSVARLALDLHELHRGETVDGVIGVTQWAIIRLVEAIGGVEIDGEFVSPGETLGLIEQGTDVEGTMFLEQLFDSLLESLDGSAFGDPQFELIRAINEIVVQKDLMLFSADDADQRLIEDLQLSGSFPVNGADRIAVVDSNVGWSKSDRSIERSAAYSVDLTDPGRPTSELTLSYRNTGSEIGRSCDSHSPPGADVAIYSVSRSSCYWNYFRAYVANGVAVTDSPELPLPANSVPDRENRQEAGTSTFSHRFDQYGDHLSGLVAIAPGDSVKFAFGLELPASVMRATETGFEYELALVAQPGARGRSTAVELLLPDGHTLGSMSHAPEAIDGKRVRFVFDLMTDETLRVEIVAAE